MHFFINILNIDLAVGLIIILKSDEHKQYLGIPDTIQCDMKITMIFIDDKVTRTTIVWVQLRVGGNKYIKFLPSKFTNPLNSLHKPVGGRLKIPALDLYKQQHRLFSKVNAFKKYLWNAYYLPGTILHLGCSCE